MAYIRHRDRMVRESVFEDLQNTLIACSWLAGTTSKAVLPVDGSGGVAATVTTAPAATLQLLEGSPINLIDAFPENDPAPTDDTSGRTPFNTFAMDTGRPGQATPLELGNALTYEKPYTFNYAFYAVSDAVALAVMNDLADRYKGHIVDGDAIDLYNYLAADPTTPVMRMDVESFRYARDTEQTSTSFDVHLYFAELVIVDLVET
jgi:hypothetical protein